MPPSLQFFDEGGDDRPVVAALLRAGEEGAFPIQAKGRIDRSTALVSSSMRQSSMKRPAGGHIANGFAQLAHGADLPEPDVKKEPEILDDDAACVRRA